MLLARYGANTTAVNSAHAALDAFEQERFDIILSDTGMPVEDGYTLIRKIRARETDGNHATPLPAIALTAYAGSGDGDIACRAGFQLHVPKPIDPPDLVAKIQLLTTQAK